MRTTRLRLPKRVAVLLCAVLVIGGRSWAQAPESATEPALSNPADTQVQFQTQPAPVPAQDTPQAPSAESTQKLDQLQDDLNILKEEIFRSKARTLLLQEFLVNTQVEVYFKNAAKKNYRLKSALYILDNSEIYKKEYTPGEEPKRNKEQKVFSGVTTPGRHEISVVLTYQGTKNAGYSDNDYEFQLTGDYSFIAERGETSVVTVTAVDTGRISKDTDVRASHYNTEVDIKVESDRLATLRRRIEKRTFMLNVETAAMLESYQMVSDRINIGQQYATVFPVTARASWWFLEHFGIEGYYTYAQWSAKTGINGQKVDLTTKWFGFDAKLRYAFFRSIMSPVVVIRLGYNFLNFDVSGNQSPIIRPTEKYDYLDVGLEGKLPITSTLGLQAQAIFFPYMNLDESPVTSGRSGNTRGFEWRAGVYWNFWKDLTADLGYRFVLIDNKFTGRATRTDSTGATLSLVQSREILQGITLGLKYEF